MDRSDQHGLPRLPRRLKCIAAALCLFVAGCPDTPSGPGLPGDAGRSPNATLRPSPRSSLSPPVLQDASLDGPIGIPADSKGRLILRDAGVPDPTPLVPAQPLPRDRIANREMPGVTITARWNWDLVPAPPSGAEVNTPGIKAARAATEHLWQVEILDSGRMRVVFDSPSFPVTKFTEIRSRADHFGHILVWPNSDTYRVITPGALRALLDERRIDVSPLVPGRVSPEESGKPRFGFPTRKATLSTPWGKLTLEQARTVNVGVGGPLLCRLLVELVGVQPESPVCEDNKVPVHARFEWKDGGAIELEVTTLLIRSDFPASLFAFPPPEAIFAQEGLPPQATGILLTREQMASFRSRASEPPKVRTDPEATSAPGEGILAVNQTDAMRFLLVDGIPVAWVPAHGQQYLIGSRNGRYSVQWRSFLGTEIDEPKDVIFPARVALGETPDAGTAAGAAGAPPD